MWVKVMWVQVTWLLLLLLLLVVVASRDVLVRVLWVLLWAGGVGSGCT